MDRRGRQFSPSMSRSPPRHGSPERGRRHRNRSFSRSRSRSNVRRRSQSSRGDKEWTRERQERYHYSLKRSVSHERSQYRKRPSSNNRQSRRSRSQSTDRYVTRRSHRDASPSQTRRPSQNYRHQQSPSPRRRSIVSHVRNYYTRSRSPSDQGRRPIPRYDSPSSRRQSSSKRHRSPSSRSRSVTPRCSSSSPQYRRSPSPRRQKIRHLTPSPRRYSQHQRSESPRHRNSSVRRRSRDRRSRSRSKSHRRRSHDAASRSSSPRGRSSSRNMDRRCMDPPVAQKSPVALPGTSPMTTSADEKQYLKEANKGDRVADDHCSSTAGSHDHRGGNIHDASHGSNHHQVDNRRPLQQDACTPSSSMAMQGSSPSVKLTTTSDRVTTSFPRGGQSSASTPTRSTRANGNPHTVSPVVNIVVNPIVEKKRQAQRESHRAYLKSNSDYNRAEIKYVSIEAELRLAEFWLEIMTKNLEDVGKRIEVHDWNFQKITGQDESNAA